MKKTNKSASLSSTTVRSFPRKLVKKTDIGRLPKMNIQQELEVGMPNLASFRNAIHQY